MKKIILLIALILGLSSCDSRNPASIREERAGRPTPTMLPDRPRVRGPRRVNRQAPVPAAPRPTLKPGKVIANSTETIEGELEPLNLQKMILAGELEVKGYIRDHVRMFDGNVTTLYRTDGVNPIVLDFEFGEPVNLKTIRIYPSYSSYDWAVYINEQERGIIIRSVPSEQWSRLDLEKPTKTKKVRLEVLRIERDNYVHLNEVEMYTQ